MIGLQTVVIAIVILGLFYDMFLEEVGMLLKVLILESSTNLKTI